MRTLFALLALAACTSDTVDAPPASEPAPTAQEPAPVPVDPAGVTVDVLDRATLDALERSGWSLAAVLARAAGEAAPEDPHPDLAWSYGNQGAWRALSDSLGADIQRIVDGVDRPLVIEHGQALAWPAGNVGRAFDTRWLRSSDAFFSLAGVINRLDRRDLHPAESCGEVRVIYRLAYATELDGRRVGSRLPLTLNVVLVPRERRDCARVARGWAELSPRDPVPALLAGPLAPDGLQLDRIEVNAQVVRFPSGLETDFAGQALYLLDVYALDEGRVVHPPLENTPDVARLRADPAQRADLVAWIAEHVADIDQGTYRLPDRFLATEALSWSTLGVNRLANRPFSALFDEQALASLPDPLGTDDLRFVASRTGLVERLDNGTCVGCHQAGSTAGFHLLGPDDPDLSGVTNRLAQPVSPHLAQERLLRQRYVAAVASGSEPERFRAHSLAPGPGEDGYAAVAVNQPCLPEAHRGDLQPSAQWSCAPEAGRCRVVAADPRSALNWGQCVPEEPRTAGMTCRAGSVTSRHGRADHGPWNLHAYEDRFTHAQIYGLPEDKRFSDDAFNCRPTVIGVPLGRTYRSCTAEERSLKGVLAHGSSTADLCGVVGGASFDRCVEQDFHACLQDIVGRGMLATCSADRPCREDTICQALPWQLEGVPTEAGRALAEAGVGFCTPTYFLFQLRLDGHPVPRSAGG